MTPVRLYLAYRRSGLRRAWALAGMWSFVFRLAAGVSIGVALAAATSAIAQHERDIHTAAERRVAERVFEQSKLIANLSRFLAECLGPREGVIWIDGEAHFCKAIATGITR